MRYVALLLLLTGTALARDNGQWNDQPINIRQWFQSLMQPDNPYMSCCGEADAFEADTFEVDGDHYVAVVTDGKGVIPSGTRINVPNQKMKWDRATRPVTESFSSATRDRSTVTSLLAASEQHCTTVPLPWAVLGRLRAA